MRGRTKAEQGTRERLLAAALEAFAARGFEGASTRSIAEAAAAPQGLVRHHFASKEGLWLAVVDGAIAKAAADLDQQPGGLTVAAWVALAEQHAELAGVLVHAVLEGGARAELARVKAAPLVERLTAFQAQAQPHAGAEQRLLWLAASLALPLLRRGVGSLAEPTSLGHGRAIDVLFTWLTSTPAPRAAGPFALNTARSHLRGTS